MHLGEDAMSSEDEDYRYDESTNSTVAAVEKEGDKNRVIFEGYLLKLGRNKVNVPTVFEFVFCVVG
jgi:hypothetical protein